MGREADIFPFSTGQLTERLEQITSGLPLMLPELVLTGVILFLIIADLIKKNKHTGFFHYASLAGLLLVFVSGMVQLMTSVIPINEPVLISLVKIDGLAIYFQTIFIAAALFTLLFSYCYQSGENGGNSNALYAIGEYYTLLFGLLLGSLLLVMANHLLMVYLSIEFISITSYLLVNFNFTKCSGEGGLKYLLFGAVSSGIMLYGISLVYGISGSFAFSDPQFWEGLQNGPFIWTLLAGMLIFGGFLFKISTVPFHLWAPDIYQSGPTPIIAFFSVVPKAAGIVVLIRFLQTLPGGEWVFINDYITWQNILALVAMASMLVGNLAAIWQDNAKRMMAYSSIAHAGVLVAGVLCYSELGIQSVLFYAAIYLLMNFGAFIIINHLNRITGYENISEYKGMGFRLPFAGVLVIIVMIALTGLPPTAGFTGKLFVFTAVWENYQASGNDLMFVLVLTGLANTVISLFYYLKIPYYMFFKNEGHSEDASNFISENMFNKNRGEMVLTTILVLPLLILFLKPDWLMAVINLVTYQFY